MNARETILANIGKSLKESGLSPSPGNEIESRLGSPRRNTVPGRGDGDMERRTAVFIAEAERVDATTVRLDGLDGLGGAVEDFIATHGLPGRIRISRQAPLEDVNWAKHPLLEVLQGRAVDDDRVSLTVAFCGVAETGTIVVHSGPESPTSLNFLPDNHIVLLPQSLLVGAYEGAWAMLRNQAMGMPRTVNWITGPSRSADIEQTLLLGAHGPRRLHIVILNDEKTGRP